MVFPIDSLTKRPKGFAFVTYMIPENAVSALAQLDGHVFQVTSLFSVALPQSRTFCEVKSIFSLPQGRMLHLLPSIIKKEKADSTGYGSTAFKRQKDAKDKAASSRSVTHTHTQLCLQL